jgi:hypothetical protein
MVYHETGNSHLIAEGKEVNLSFEESIVVPRMLGKLLTIQKRCEVRHSVAGHLVQVIELRL